MVLTKIEGQESVYTLTQNPPQAILGIQKDERKEVHSEDLGFRKHGWCRVEGEKSREGEEGRGETES